MPNPDHREAEVWLHIGLMYRPPLRATFSGLEVEAHDGDAGEDCDGPVHADKDRDKILADELAEGVNLEDAMADTPSPMASSRRAASANAEGEEGQAARRRGRATALTMVPGGSIA